MVEPYRYDDNNCDVEASADIIAKMFGGELSFDRALGDGLVQIKSGDPAKLKALEWLVPFRNSNNKSADKSSAMPGKKQAAATTKTTAKKK